MSDLTKFRDHARERAGWASGAPRINCAARTLMGTPKPRDHANCPGLKCGCQCHEPTDRERAMWTALADEIDSYLSTSATASVDLFGETTTEPQPEETADA